MEVWARSFLDFYSNLNRLHPRTLNPKLQCGNLYLIFLLWKTIYSYPSYISVSNRKWLAIWCLFSVVNDPIIRTNMNRAEHLEEWQSSCQTAFSFCKVRFYGLNRYDDICSVKLKSLYKDNFMLAKYLRHSPWNFRVFSFKTHGQTLPVSCVSCLPLIIFNYIFKYSPKNLHSHSNKDRNDD